jgi:serine/threonine protein kinase
VLDFGISKRIDPMPRDGITSPESMIGTLTHMSPEQIQDPSAATEASDQYALGVMLYEMVTARLPFFGASPYQLMHNILNASVVAPSAFNPALPKELDEVVLRALERDPARRFASIEAFGSRLLGFADGDTFALWKRTSAGPAAAAGRTLDESRETLASPPATPKAHRLRALELRSVALGFGAGIAALAVLGGSFAPRRTPSSLRSEAPAVAPLPPIVTPPPPYEAPVAGAPVAIAPLNVESAFRVTTPSVRTANTSGAQLKVPPSSASPLRPAGAKSPLPKSDATVSKSAAVETKSKGVVEGTNAAPIFE